LGLDLVEDAGQGLHLLVVEVEPMGHEPQGPPDPKEQALSVAGPPAPGGRVGLPVTTRVRGGTEPARVRAGLAAGGPARTLPTVIKAGMHGTSSAGALAPGGWCRSQRRAAPAGAGVHPRAAEESRSGPRTCQRG